LRYCALEHLVDRALAARFEFLGQGVKVNIAQVNPTLITIGLVCLMDDITLGRDGAVEQFLYLLHDWRNVYRWRQGADFLRDDLHRCHLGGECLRGRVR